MHSITRGTHVKYVDETGNEHDALVTECWGQNNKAEFPDGMPGPALNLVFVTDKEGSRDQYGQQLERRSSAVHKRHQGAGVNYWYAIGEQ